MAIQRVILSVEASFSVDGSIRKRVRKACDRCRLKKCKCDGSNQCGRCKVDKAVCVLGERKRSHSTMYSDGYVEILERQHILLIKGLQELYRRIQNGQGWIGNLLKDTSHGKPLTHDILQRLGALRQKGHALGNASQEGLKMTPQRQVGAGSMKQGFSSDASSDAVPATVSDHISQKAPLYTDLFASNQLPPAPPYQSLSSQTTCALAETKPPAYPQICLDHLAVSPAGLLPKTWGPSIVALDDEKEIINRVESSTSFDIMSPRVNRSLSPSGLVNPCVPMLDFFEEEDF